jgi:hypothetical protein
MDRCCTHSHRPTPPACGHTGILNFCRHQQHGEVLIHSRKPATVDLNHIDELLEHHPVMAVFTGSDPNGGNLPANAGVPKDVVWTRGFFHPPWIYLGEFLGAVDYFHNIPFLVRVHHQLVEGPNFRSHQMGPTKIVGRIAAHLQLEMGPTLGETFAAYWSGTIRGMTREYICHLLFPDSMPMCSE